MKAFLLFLFKRDIEFINELSIREKKYFIYYTIIYIIFFLYFFYIEVIKVEKVLFYFILCIIYLIYKILMELLISYTISNTNNLKILIRKNNENFYKLLKILLFIQKWKNPILLLLLYIDKIYFKMFKFIIYNFKTFKFLKNLTDKQKLYIYFIQYLILNLITGPVKVVFGFFYSFLRRIIEIPFSFFFVIRSINLVLSLFIFVDLFNYLYKYYGYINMYIFFYIFLIFISMLAKFINRDFVYLFSKIKIINNFYSTDYIIFLRNHSTFYGNLIFIIMQSREYNVENLLEKKYMDVLSINLMQYVKESFYKYWELEKRTNWLNSLTIWEDIKNRPSLYLYGNLNIWLNLGAGPYIGGPNFITSLIYIKYKCEKLKLKFPENIQKEWDYLYNVNLLRLKLLLFMLWDIDDYIGYKNTSRINCVLDEILNIFFIGFDIESSLKSKNSYMNVFIEGIKVIEKDLKFYDIEDNIKFFDRLFLIIGAVPYTEDPTTTVVWDDLLDNYVNSIVRLEEYLSNFYQDNIQKEETWVRYKEMSFKENNYIPLIEYKIRDWIILFLEEQREEWELLQKKESIEERNWRLINKIENLLLKK